MSKKIEEIKQDKKNLLVVANEYGDRYKTEILEGTEQRAKLLSEGASRGLSENEVMQQYHGFLPTVYTPLLNLLYFMLRESDNDPHYGPQHYEERNKLNEEFGSLREDDIEKTILKDTPDLEEYLYGKISFDMFDRIKKLKALAQSSNPAEAGQAFIKCRDLCKAHGLDYDKVPCYTKNK
jgi:hypothetical protein